MKLWDHTLATPEENVACDETLLDWCEAAEEQAALRFWEPASYFVVLGYANLARKEAYTDFCEKKGIPILRRCSGGGTVLQGPGVLNYALVLPITNQPPFNSISATNCFIMERHRTVLSRLLDSPVELRGHTDLAIKGLKFCGNAQRRKKRFLLFHGSFLLGLDLELMQQALPMPSKQPDYRLDRTHSEFVTNLRLPAAALKKALAEAWGAASALTTFPSQQLEELVREKYSRQEWNYKF